MPKKKNQSKVNRVINFFKPTTPAKGMLLFAIVFAVLGGGYYLYKSQAASFGIPPYVCVTPKATIRYGSTGNCVKYLQWTLNKHTDANLVVDGIFGSKTDTAVKNFQKYNFLTVDGIVGKYTWQYVDAEIKQRFTDKGVLGSACTNVAIKDRKSGTIVSPTSLSSSRQYMVLVTLKNMGTARWGTEWQTASGNSGGMGIRSTAIDANYYTVVPYPAFNSTNHSAYSGSTISPGQTFTFGNNQYSQFYQGKWIIASTLYPPDGYPFGPDCVIRITVY